jgi:hypothetical protein
MTDEEFVRAFESGKVTPEQFDHRAHVRVAWVYLQESDSLEAALPRMREAIQRFAAAAGASQKYHETITVLWMRLLDDVKARVGARFEMSEVLRDFPSLADKDLPLKYYSRDRLFSEEARGAWVAPDLQPLDDRPEGIR